MNAKESVMIANDLTKRAHFIKLELDELLKMTKYFSDLSETLREKGARNEIKQQQQLIIKRGLGNSDEKKCEERNNTEDWDRDISEWHESTMHVALDKTTQAVVRAVQPQPSNKFSPSCMQRCLVCKAKSYKGH